MREVGTFAKDVYGGEDKADGRRADGIHGMGHVAVVLHFLEKDGSQDTEGEGRG